MITGYNTDVSHEDVVLHVQTEDKGVDNPFIESLIYVGGQVLVAKRANYGDKLSQGSGKKEIVALMERQHRTMIAAIRQGKFDGKLSALVGREVKSDTQESSVVSATKASPAGGGAGAAPPIDSPPQVPKSEAVAGAESTPATESPSPPAAEAKGVSDRSLDQVILEYLAQEAKQEQLMLEVEDERDLALGRSAVISIRTASSLSGDPITGAEISVRMISTTEDPKVLGSGETGDGGRLELAFDVPRLERGTPALIVSALSDLGQVEVKRLL